MDSFLNHTEDDDSDDELLLKPSGLLKSPPPATFAETVSSQSSTDTSRHINKTSPQQQQQKEEHSTSAVSAPEVISQEESSSSSLSLLVSTPQQPTPTGCATTSTSDDGMSDVNKNNVRDAMNIEAIMKEAQDVYKCKTIQYNEIHSTSLLKWYAKPKTKSKKASSSSSRKKQKQSTAKEQFDFVYPCYICPNVQQAIAGYEDKLTTPENKSINDNATTSLVRFIGFRVSYRDKIQAVPTKHLIPYNYRREDDSNSNGNSLSTKNDDQMVDTDMVVPTANDNYLITDRMKPEQQWNTNLMSIYLKSLKSGQQEFKNSNKAKDSVTGEYKLKVEEKLLQTIATSVLEREQQTPSKNDVSWSAETQEVADDDDDLPATSPHKLDSTAIVSARKAANGKQRQRPVTTVSKLRAGDIIEYCPPHLVADKMNIVRSTVMECSPRQDPAVLVSTGHWLPMDHQIRIVQQRHILNSIKNEYQYIDTHPNESYIRISMLKLDARQNGCMDGMVSTNTEKLGKVYKNAVQEISSSISKYGDGTSSSAHKANENGSCHDNDDKETIKRITEVPVWGKKRKRSGSSSLVPSQSLSKSVKSKNSNSNV